MKRRLVIVFCLLGVVGGSVDAALASPVTSKNHQICLVLSDSSDYKHGQYLCIDSPDD